MTSSVLHNTLPREKLKEKLASDPKPRYTVSFYQYRKIGDPKGLRDELFAKWEPRGVLGRIYVAHEGINAQMSLPQDEFHSFRDELLGHFPGMPIKFAIEEAKDAFLKLIVRVKEKIVADGLDDETFDPGDVGQHLSAKEFNEAMEDPDSVVVDVRNHYESEIGHFEGAICPDVDTFREELPVILETLKGKEDKKILLYCTGGIRCEKTSAWLRHKGFRHVGQLHGGIIDYVRQVREQNLTSKFKGKNFVFDERLGERVTPDVLAKCCQCHQPADTHTNCRWQACHVLFVQCPACSELMQGCCSPECLEKIQLPMEEQLRLRREAPQNPPGFFSRKRPHKQIRLSAKALRRLTPATACGAKETQPMSSSFDQTR